MGLISKLLNLRQTRNYDEIEQRKQDGFTAWHPEYGDVYYPPTQPAGPNEYNQYSPLNESSDGSDNYLHT